MRSDERRLRARTVIPGSGFRPANVWRLIRGKTYSPLTIFTVAKVATEPTSVSQDLATYAHNMVPTASIPDGIGVVQRIEDGRMAYILHSDAGSIVATDLLQFQFMICAPYKSLPTSGSPTYQISMLCCVGVAAQ